MDFPWAFAVANQILINLAIGAVVSTILAAVSIRARSLSFSGAIGAILIGTAIYGEGGWVWYVILLSFFLSSSFLTRFRYSTKVAKGVSELKAGARSIWQTVGQGGNAAIIAGVALLLPINHGLLTVGFVAALAEANADTWAVELGVLSKRNPRLITKFSTEVAPGTSGGISGLGELSAFAGSLFVALVAGVLGLFGAAPAVLPLVSTVAAIIGEHIDSVLGATVQAAYYCPTCKKETERRTHKCGTAARHVKGFQLVTNEAVNFISTGFAALVAMTLYLFI
jgi:uncharacterized protein (TIGR00297 family)